MERLLVLSLFLCLASAYIKEGKLVNIMSEEDFDKFNEEFQSSLRVFLFYSPYSQQSSLVTPSFFTASKELAQENLEIKFAKVSVSTEENKPLVSRLKTKGVPSIKYSIAGQNELLDYRSQMKKETFVRVFTDMLPSMITLKNVEDLEEYYKTTKYPAYPLIIGKFAEFAGEQYDIFMEFAHKYSHRYRFALAKDSGEWSAHFEVEKDAVVIPTPPMTYMFKSKDFYHNYKFQTLQQLTDFIEEEGKMFVLWVTKENEQYLLDTKKPLFLYLEDFDQKEDTKTFEKYKNDLIEALKPCLSMEFYLRACAIAMGDRRDFIKDLEPENLTGDKQLAILKTPTGKFVIREDMVKAGRNLHRTNIKKFFQSYMDGELEPFVKSETQPTVQYENGIRIAVGETFKKLVVNNKDIDQLILVYYKGEARSEEILEKIESFGAMYEYPEEFQILKIDGHYNQIPSAYRTRVPGLYYAFKKGKLDPSFYDGSDFEFESVKSFIEGHMERWNKRDDL